MATKKVLACSHSRSLQLLCTVSSNQAKLDVRSEFESRKRGGVKLVVQQAVYPRTIILVNIKESFKGNI